MISIFTQILEYYQLLLKGRRITFFLDILNQRLKYLLFFASWWIGNCNFFNLVNDWDRGNATRVKGRQKLLFLKKSSSYLFVFCLLWYSLFFPHLTVNRNVLNSWAAVCRGKYRESVNASFWLSPNPIKFKKLLSSADIWFLSVSSSFSISLN